jgi:uncharacterized protein (TIGR02118 family)
VIKLVYVVRARADVASEEFYRYWRDEHAPKVRAVAEAIRARRYVQSHTIDTPLNAVLIDSRAMSPLFEGITEVWWDSIEDLQQAAGTPEGAEAMKLLVEDEARFIDLTRSTIFMTEEHEIFDLTSSD